MTCCLQTTLHINLHILYTPITYFKKVQKFKNYQNRSSTSIVTNMAIFIILFKLFSIYISVEFKVKIRFSGEPMTQYTHESCVNVNHVRT